MPVQKQSFGTMVKKVIDRNTIAKPGYGTVYSIDCDRIDVRIGTSSTVLRHVQVLGSIDSLRIGQQVYLRWEKGRPVAVLAQDTYADSITPRTVVQPDGATIEYSASGLRVKPQGIGLEHLNFTPSQQGHTHGDDPFTASGWKVDDDGVIWQYRTFINPMGQIQLGVNQDIIKLDSADNEYRLWAGDPDPLLANFAVGVDGSVRLTAGTVGGVDIGETELTSGSVHLTGSGVWLDDIEIIGGSSAEGYVLAISGSTAIWVEAASGGDITEDAAWQAAGDIIVATGSAAASVLPIGDEGQILTVSGSSLAWDDPPAGYDIATDPVWEAYGDLIMGTGNNTADILPIGADGTWLKVSGSAYAWVAGPSYQSTFSFAGVIGVLSPMPLRIYNQTGASRTISKVFISVNTAPTGANAILVDIHKNGTTIFTNQAHRPTITAGNFSGSTTDIDVSAFADGEYLQACVDRVGSTVKGSDLTITVVYA